MANLAPRNPFRVAYVTPGYLDVLAPSTIAHTSGIYFGSAVAQELPHAVGQRVDLGNGSRSTLEGVLPDQTRDNDQARWIFVAGLSDTHSSECWVEAIPGALRQVTALMPSALWSSKNLAIQAVYLGHQDTIREAFASRPTKLTGLLAGAIAGILLGFASTRRSERALLSILGFNRVRVVLMVAMEQALLVWVALAATVPALAAAWIWIGLNGAFSARMALTQISMAVGVTLLLGAAIAWVSTLGDPSITVRNRD